MDCPAGAKCQDGGKSLATEITTEISSILFYHQQSRSKRETNVQIYLCLRRGLSSLTDTWLVNGPCCHTRGLYDAASFEPIANGSVWEVITDDGGISMRRLLECPPGYELKRDEAYPINDNCLACESGYYRLDRTTMNSSKVNSTS